MRGKHAQGAIGIEDHVEPAEQRLVGARALDAAGGEAVGDEGRHPDAVEFLRPAVDITADAARAVQQDDRGQPLGPGARDAQHAGNRHRPCVLIAGEELLVRKREGWHRVQFGARHLRRARAGQAKAAANNASGDASNGAAHDCPLPYMLFSRYRRVTA